MTAITIALIVYLLGAAAVVIVAMTNKIRVGKHSIPSLAGWPFLVIVLGVFALAVLLDEDHLEDHR